jgi:hypothetical protein
LLISWCAGGRYGLACSGEDRGRNRRPSTEDRGWSHRSGTRWPSGREVGWRHVRSAPYTWRRGARVSWLSLKTKIHCFSSVWASKPMTMVCEWFGLKTTRTVFTGLASKPTATFSSSLALEPAATVSSGCASKPAATISNGLSSKLAATVFSSLASKLVAMVSPSLSSKPVVGFLLEPQNQCGGGFLGLGLKTGSFGLVIWASKSPLQFLGLGLKIKWGSVC